MEIGFPPQYYMLAIKYCEKSTKVSRWYLRYLTLAQLTQANWQVMDEMEQLGLWSNKLDDIDVYLVPVSFVCYGWFLPDGNIYIPAVPGANLSDLISGHHTRLTDVLRHE